MVDIRAQASKMHCGYSQARERRDRQALRSSPALRRAPKTLARRADLRQARAMPKAGQALGMSQPQSARFPQARFYSPHASKAMQSKMMFPDRLLASSWKAVRFNRLSSFHLSPISVPLEGLLEEIEYPLPDGSAPKLLLHPR